MAIDPKHAEAKADAKPDTAQADAVESNRESKKGILPDGWTFTEISRQYNACDDPAVKDLPTEFWIALGLEKWADVPVQMARLITYAHSLDLFHLKGKTGGPEKVRELAEKMGTTVDQLYRIVEQSIAQYSQFERRIALFMTDENGEYAGASGEVNLAGTPGMANGDLDPEGDHDLPFSEGYDPKLDGESDLDVDATIKAVDEELDESPGMDAATETDSDKEEDDKEE